jgi:hypothetical protein
MHEDYRARTARLEFERLSGTLISADEVRGEAFNAGRRVRAALLAMASRLAPVLAALSDPIEIHRILTAEIRQVLEELARDAR